MPDTPSRQDYLGRINRVRDYIDTHLVEPLTLARLAEVACFSPYHFHRLFRALTGEPLGQYIQRLRLERAAAHLRHMRAKPVTHVAMDCGFSSSAAFARAFRERFGLSPSAWRSGGSKIGTTERKNGQAQSRLGKSSPTVDLYVDPGTNTVQWRISMDTPKKLTGQVEVKDLPETTVAYLRHLGPWDGDKSWFGQLMGRLMQWAAVRGLFRPGQTQVLAVYRDDPSITDADKIRTDVCVTVPPEAVVDGEIGKTTLPGGRYAVAHFEVTADQFGQAWESMYGGWLPDSGFEPDDRPPLEIYGKPTEGPDARYPVDICIPVRKLAGLSDAAART